MSWMVRWDFFLEEVSFSFLALDFVRLLLVPLAEYC